MTVAGTLLLLLAPSSTLFGTSIQSASAASSSTITTSGSGSSATCDQETSACYGNTECETCISGWGAASSVSDCRDRFPGVSDGNSCEQQGAAYCCNLGDEAQAESCMTNGLFVDYWACFIAGFHCSIDDMPCYDATAVISTAPPSASPETPQPTEATSTAVPTATPTSSGGGVSSTYITRGVETATAFPTASPSASPSTMDSVAAVCSSEAETCLDDATCQGCYVDAADAADISPAEYSACQEGYLEQGSDHDVCDILSSLYCCSNDQSETDCFANGESSSYWGCVFEYHSCSVEEITCLGSSDFSFASDDEAVSTDVGDGAASDEADETLANGSWAVRSPREGAAEVRSAFSATMLTATLIGLGTAVVFGVLP